MLYLDIKEVKGAMKESYFQYNIGGMAVCTRIIIKSTKGCGKLSPNDIFFTNSWFIGVKTQEEANVERLFFWGSVKTSHKEFCLDTLENK